MQGKLLGNGELKKIAAAHGKSVAQVILRWDTQHGVVTIPKSSKRGRAAENFDIFDFKLSAAEMARIDRLDQGERIGPDPEDFPF
jgi:diketogulonate reductase-like aldo/keto reductase